MPKPNKKKELSQHDKTLLGLVNGIDADLVRGQCAYCLWHANCLKAFSQKAITPEFFAKWVSCHKGSQWEPGVLVK